MTVPTLNAMRRRYEQARASIRVLRRDQRALLRDLRACVEALTDEIVAAGDPGHPTIKEHARIALRATRTLERIDR